ncbi:hypothetical protein CERSUDRAFT_117568 [Gelatoporia subvermispora B]|uniref:BRO1 domain-containing protein n=1 Tax=Ceriporiopsis subvermispora (strain B) TaxID=914234 RepID=M2QPG5_CERS8|nr:hypothetical protein CERSUDRAFT_117568 [Gelatoporia subvermispora B]
MPNQLVIPSKSTSALQIGSALRNYISANHPDTSPNAFAWDVERWEELRSEAVKTTVHSNQVSVIQRYHAQLVFILTKLSVNIGLEISYLPAFEPSAPPLILRNLAYERTAVLFNLAALYSQLAGACDRSTADGIKRAIGYYQNAAGVLMYTRTTASLKLQQTVSADTIPTEFDKSALTSLENLMLAQAQECVWQKAVMDHYKNAIIAKLSAKVSSLYRQAAENIKTAQGSIHHVYPSNWLPHMEAKYLHFSAAAQYRKSVDDLEAGRYGHEISRLTEAQSLAKRGFEVARRGNAAPAVMEDLKSILDNVQNDLVRAERDNYLIYHHDPPPVSALPAVQEISMVQPLAPPALTDPKSVIDDDDVLFADLVPDAARVAIEVYRNRREGFVQELGIRVNELDQKAAKTLGSLGLPAALDALDRPIGLPPSILKKAEEVRLENGVLRIESVISNVSTLAKHNMSVLLEALDALAAGAAEAVEDSSFRESHDTSRVESSQANEALIGKAFRYREILEQAAESDELVRQKYDEWSDNIKELILDEEQLEAIVPSSTLGRQTVETQHRARELRRLLELLDDVQKERASLLQKANDHVPHDDPTQRVLSHAASFQRWTEIEPRMFDDCLSRNMDYYEDVQADIEETEMKQNALIKSIMEKHVLLVDSRREDPSVKEREHALQSLDLAYHKYKEIVRNLDEGMKFYNGFSEILSQFKRQCKEWANERRLEMQSLAAAVRSVSLASDQNQSPGTPPASPTRQITAHELPPLDSDEWQATVLPPAPVATRTPRRTAGRAGR